jgi:hypothetical protein
MHRIPRGGGKTDGGSELFKFRLRLYLLMGGSNESQATRKRVCALRQAAQDLELGFRGTMGVITALEFLQHFVG